MPPDDRREVVCFDYILYLFFLTSNDPDSCLANSRSSDAPSKAYIGLIIDKHTHMSLTLPYFYRGQNANLVPIFEFRPRSPLKRFDFEMEQHVGNLNVHYERR